MAILRRLRDVVPENEFDVWLLQLEPVMRDGRLCLSAPFGAFRERVESKYAKAIRAAAGGAVPIIQEAGYGGMAANGSWREEFRRPHVKLSSTLPRVTEEDLKEEHETTDGVSASLATIIRVGARERGLTVEEVLARDRTRRVASIRHEIAYLCRTLTDHSSTEIGQALGGRNHSSVLRSVEQVSDKVEHNLDYKRRIKEIIRAIRYEAASSQVNLRT